MILLMCISILYAVTNVSGNEVKRENHNNVRRLVRDVFEYNHPPSVFSVPVAIVYEEGSRGEKSVNTEVKAKKHDDQADITTTEATVLTEITTNKVLKARFSVNNEPKIKPHLKDELIIPVAVMYDDESENLPSTSKATLKSKSANRRQRDRKVIKIASQEDREEEVTLTSQESQGSTKFPKRTQKADPIVPILQLENYVFSDSGNYHYSYEGGDGTKASMRGELRSLDDDNVGAAVEGSFSYIGKDGIDYSLTYTADENGYRPIGVHLPTPPPIPPAIARALQYLATKTTPQPVTESL